MHFGTTLELPLNENYKVYCKNSEYYKEIIEKYGGTVLDKNDKSYFILVTSEEDVKDIDKENYDFYVRRYHEHHKFLEVYDKDLFINALKEWDKDETALIGKFYRIILKNRFYEYQEFEQYNQIRSKFKMDFDLYKIDYNNSRKFKLPFEIILYIFHFLEIKGHLRMRLLSKDFKGYDNFYWKMICENFLKENKWLPQIPLKKLNTKYLDWIQFYRERFPLLKYEGIGNIHINIDQKLG